MQVSAHVGTPLCHCMQANEASDVYSVGVLNRLNTGVLNRLNTVLYVQTEPNPYLGTESGDSHLQRCRICSNASEWFQSVLVCTRLDDPLKRPSAEEVLSAIETVRAHALPCFSGVSDPNLHLDLCLLHGSLGTLRQGLCLMH